MRAGRPVPAIGDEEVAGERHHVDLRRLRVDPGDDDRVGPVCRRPRCRQHVGEVGVVGVDVLAGVGADDQEVLGLAGGGLVDVDLLLA